MRSIARETGRSRNTVKKVVRGENPKRRKSRGHKSKLEPYKEHAKERHETHGLSAVRILEEIRSMGYEGSVQTLRRYLQQFRTENIRKSKVTVEFRTAIVSGIRIAVVRILPKHRTVIIKRAPPGRSVTMSSAISTPCFS